MKEEDHRMKTGQTVRDTVTGLTGKIVLVGDFGVRVDRGENAEQRFRIYTWRAAYRQEFPGHRRLEVVA